MPSLQQLRWEAFADAVESATRPALLQTLAPIKVASIWTFAWR